MFFAELTAPEIRALSRDETLIIAPIAAMEQHGPHLPVATDTMLATAVASGVEKALGQQALVLPVLWLGASDHHLPFGGTLTSPLPNYTQILVDILTPLLREGFRRVMILNGHGGNIDPLRVALRRLDVDFPDAILTGGAYWEMATEELAPLCQGPLKGMGHACEIETSMILHLHPHLVKRNLIRDDPDTTPTEFKGLSWARDFGRSTDHGAVGYPEHADAERGRLMLEAVVAKVSTLARQVLALPLP